MAKKKHISAVLSLKDNMSATMKGVRKEQKAFQREVAQTRKAMESLSKKKIKMRVDSSAASKKIKEFTKSEKYLNARSKIVKTVALKDMATSKLKAITSTTKRLGSKIIKPVVTVIDRTKGAIGGIMSKLGGLAKGFTIPVAMAMAGGAAMLKSGMELESQQVSMEHFMGVGNKDKKPADVKKMTASYIKDLRNNANNTPFETGEVIAAGTRALQINGGDTKEAMKTVKLAEDMAAMNPGKSISDAMEALADSRMGETERLKEFGYKGSSKDDPKKTEANLQEMYGGGAEKLASTGAGLLSTITGKLKSSVADMGLAMLEPLKPVLKGIGDMITQAQPMFDSLATSLGSGIGSAVTALTPVFQSLGQTLSTTFTAIAPVLSTVFTTLQPVFSAVLSAAQSTFNGIAGAVQAAMPTVKKLMQDLSPAFNGVASVVRSVGRAFQTVFPKIVGFVSSCYDAIRPIIQGISKLVGGVAGAVSKVAGAVSSVVGGGKKKKNATGTKYYSGGLTTVGEHGKELVELPRGSKVHSNRSTLNMEKEAQKGGNTININVYPQGGNSDTILAEIVEKLELALKNI